MQNDTLDRLEEEGQITAEQKQAILEICELTPKKHQKREKVEELHKELSKAHKSQRKENFMEKLGQLSSKNQEKIIDAFANMFHNPTVRELIDIFGRIIDDNNYLPGHKEVIVVMSHEDHDMIEKIYYWVRDEWEKECKKAEEWAEEVNDKMIRLSKGKSYEKEQSDE